MKSKLLALLLSAILCLNVVAMAACRKDETDAPKDMTITPEESTQSDSKPTDDTTTAGGDDTTDTTEPEETLDEGLVFTFDASTSTYSVTDYMGRATTITIPAEHEGYPVTSIGSSAFRACDSLTSIEIPNSVTSIGRSAFAYCDSLTSVTIGNGVTSIGSYAFSNCYSLTSIEIPNSVTSIDSRAFYDCDSLMAVYITDLAAWCGISFDNYDSNPLCYAQNLYLNGELVTDLVIPEGVTSIGNDAFYDCDNLTSITIPNSVTSIGSYAFVLCDSLTSVTIGNSVTSIGKSAFSDCSSLTSVTIGNSVTSIGDEAFFSCYHLTSIEIPNSVTSIGEYAFIGCYKLVEVINHSTLNIEAGSEDNGYVARYAKEVHSGTSKTVNVNGYLFYTYNNVNYLLGYVGADTALTLPEHYNGQNYEIYKYAFYNRDDLTSVTISNSVTSIGEDAFSGCFKLVEVINYSSLSIRAGSSGNGYVASHAIEVHSGTSKIVNVNDYLFYICDRGNYLFNYVGTDTALTLPANYNGQNYKIYNHAFRERDDLTSVTIPNSVTIIGSSAFRGCSRLTSITIPNSVTTIGFFAFYNCDSLTSVTFENTQGWKAEGTTISSSNLANPTTAATYLKSTYYSKTWTRS